MDAYIYCAALYCEDCIADIKAKIAPELRPEDPDDEYSYDSDQWPKGPYADGGGESDTTGYCEVCHTFLENPLTLEGYECVRAMLEEDLGWISDEEHVLHEVAEFYGARPRVELDCD